jgi:aerotaxis receptor
MEMKRPVPTSQESPFNFDEFFFSTTDERGVIRYGNDVFVRVSAYSKEQILGVAHSIVRHPDMPRAVFRLFWDTLKGGEPIAAYVKNLSADGSFYWVFAFAFPVEGGYLSIRFKPSSTVFAAAQKIYQDVLAFERRGDDLEAAVSQLVVQVKELGFVDYKDFMIKATLAELHSRAEHARSAETLNSGAENADASVKKIGEISHRTLTTLNEVFASVETYGQTNASLKGRIEELTKKFLTLKFVSMNMTIAATKFGEVAASLGVVSAEFAGLSQQIQANLSGLTDFAQKLTSVVEQCTFRVAALNLQMLMVDFFVKESIAKRPHSADAFAEMTENQASFSRLFHDYAMEMKKEVSSLLDHLWGIHQKLGEVGQFITGLEVIRQVGAVESSRQDDVKETFGHYLGEMTEFISLLRESFGHISHEINALEESSRRIVSEADSFAMNVETIFRLAAQRA